MRLILLFITALLPVSWSQEAENVLLDNIVVSCAKKASLSCVGDQALRYLHDTFNSSQNWQVTENFKFDRNEAPINVSPRQHRQLQDFSDVVYERGIQYLMTHDLTWSLPQTFFGGAKVKVSKPDTPSARTIFQVELIEPEVKEDESAINENTELESRTDEGRLFIKKLFGKNIKKKLLLGFFALLLIIKLIKIKLFFLLPLILGVGTVKKLAIKFLFFIFPALAALFKSCHHHHHHVPVKQYHLHTVKHQGPPAHYADDYSHHGPPDWLRRNEYVDTTAANSWDASYDSRPATPHYPDIAAQEAYSKKLKQQAAELSQKYQYRDVIPSTELPYKVAQLSYLPSDRPTAAAAIPVSNDNYDVFYSPKLVRIDRVFLQMGFNDEGCRERLVCSMYKNPTRFSPNSNLVSAELSIDPQELRTPNKATVSVRRFFKYVQAAKDGQEHKDCNRLYPSCNTNTDS